MSEDTVLNFGVEIEMILGPRNIPENETIFAMDYSYTKDIALHYNKLNRGHRQAGRRMCSLLSPRSLDSTWETWELKTDCSVKVAAGEMLTHGECPQPITTIC
jgi:hypothetical protein